MRPGCRSLSWAVSYCTPGTVTSRLRGAVLIFGFAIANELLTRKHLKAASTSTIVASSYASATFRNAEVLHAMGMLPGLRDRWLTRQDEGLQLQAAASDRAGHLVAASKFTPSLSTGRHLGNRGLSFDRTGIDARRHDRRVDHHGTRACASGNRSSKLEGLSSRREALMTE